jgi:hypothetical protein
MSPIDSRVRLDVMIPADLDHALERAVALAGTSKASILAIALAEYLEGAGAISPGTAGQIEPTPSRGTRRLTNNTKESNHE